MVKLRVTRGFYDLEASVHRKPGEVFEAREDRAHVILAADVAEVAEVVETTDEAVSATAQKADVDKRRSKGKKG